MVGGGEGIKVGPGGGDPVRNFYNDCASLQSMSECAKSNCCSLRAAFTNSPESGEFVVSTFDLRIQMRA